MSEGYLLETAKQHAREAAFRHESNSIGMGDIPARIKPGDFDHHELVRSYLDLAVLIHTNARRPA